MRFKSLISLMSAVALAGCAAPLATRVASAAAPVDVGIIALNDFHGALEPPRQAISAPDRKGAAVLVPAGGAAWLASAVQSVRARHPNHLTVAAGDLISASPLASSLYLDEPAVGVMNRLGLEFSAVGNHEFDRGREEILRVQNGGCAKFTTRTPCALERFAGAQYRYLAASTLTESGQPLLAATGLKSFGSGAGKVTVGIIGLTLKGTAQIVSPAGIAGLTFADEAATINALVPGLKAQGADAVVVLIHQGGAQEPDTDPGGCAGFSGDIRPILDAIDPRVDLVVSGHTHRAYVCDYGAYNPARPILLTSAGNNGRMITDITLTIDSQSHRVTAKRAAQVIVQSEPFRGAAGQVALTDAYPRFAPDPAVAAYIGRYVAATRDFSNRRVGAISGPVGSRVLLGQMIADAQLLATRPAGAVMSLMNRGGVRADLVPAADGSVTFGDIYTVEPFANGLLTGTISGADLRAVIEQSVDDEGELNPAIPSEALHYSFDRRRPAGSRVVDLTFAGRPVDPAGSYRLTVSAFLAGGGDGYTVLRKLRDVVPGGLDIDAFESWLKAAAVRQVPAGDRVTDLASPAAAPAAAPAH